MKTNKETNTYKNYLFVIGDWSGDGHEKKETISYSCNKNPEEAYKIGCELLGFDLIKDYCVHWYEDHIVPFDILCKIDPQSYSYEDDLGNELTQEEIDDCEAIYPEKWVQLYLKICKYDEDFDYKENEEENVIRIGGYGLFF